MNRFCIALIFTLLSFSLFAQFNPIIRTGRPGQAIGPYTLGKNVFQVQSGILYNKISFNSTETNTWLHNTVFRFGILRKLEVSSLINWQIDKHISNIENDRQSGISNTQIGLRYNLLANKKAIPAIKGITNNRVKIYAKLRHLVFLKMSRNQLVCPCSI